MPAAQYISLLARPATVSQRDRIALAAAARAVSNASLALDSRQWVAGGASCGERSHFGFAVDIPVGAHAVDLRTRLAQLMGARQLLLRLEETRLVCLVAAGQPALQDWERHDLAYCWLSAMTAEFGPISLGYSGVHVGEAGVHQSILEAARALVVGKRLGGPGHPYAFADVAVRNFMLRWHEPAELLALHEALLGPIVAHDRVAEQQLLPTLAIYLDSGCVTKHAADRLGIHRSSITYRLRQIEALAQLDLGDADIRLMLQLALRANRVVADAPHPSVHV